MSEPCLFDLFRLVLGVFKLIGLWFTVQERSLLSMSTRGIAFMQGFLFCLCV